MTNYLTQARVGKAPDVFCCVADCGWVTGHTYTIYGPLCNGATTVMFESIPTYPDPYRYALCF
jgi:acetyl-CoA synthetase